MTWEAAMRYALTKARAHHCRCKVYAYLTFTGLWRYGVHRIR